MLRLRSRFEERDTTFRNLEHACTKEDLFSRGGNGNDLHTSDERASDLWRGTAYGIDGQKRGEKEREGEREKERMLPEKTDIISDRYFAPVARILRSVRDTLLYHRAQFVARFN